MELVVANLKLYESLERNFLTLGRVSSAAFNVRAEKEQVQSLVKAAELSEEIPAFGDGDTWDVHGGAACVRTPCLGNRTANARQGRAASSFREKHSLHRHLTFVMHKWQILPGLRAGVGYTDLGVC